MNIDPTGTFPLAANQNSDAIVTFRIDASSGKLTPTGEIVHTPIPSTLRSVDSALARRGSDVEC